MDIPDFLKEHAAYRANVMLVCMNVGLRVCQIFNACICLSKLGWTDT